MTIRRCSVSDAGAVAGLATELGYPTDAAQAAARLAWLLGRAEDAVFAAEEGGAVVGWLHAREVRLLESEPFAEIAGLVVAAGRRGRGHGRALVQAALGWAAERGLATLRVRSNVARQETHRWYQAGGFEIKKTQVVFSRAVGAAGRGGGDGGSAAGRGSG
jgi:ribosomal protein S18 acetylase RimI-like enzyme